MAQAKTLVYPADDIATNERDHEIEAKKVNVTSSEALADPPSHTGQVPLVPLRMKLISILLVTAVGFGSHWSSGVTGAMKSTLKKVGCQFYPAIVGLD
jgi:hypothetical protein